MSHSNGEFFTADDLVIRWKQTITVGTLANWRSKKRGPPFVKIGGKVLYPVAALLEWESKNVRVANDNESAASSAA